MAMGKSSGLRQLIGTTRDQFLDLLHALEERVACKKFEDFWCAKKFCCGFHPGFLLSRESVPCQLRRTRPFGSQPCAATLEISRTRTSTVKTRPAGPMKPRLIREVPQIYRCQSPLT